MLTDNRVRLRAPEPADVDAMFLWENSEEAWLTGAMSAPLSHKQLWDYVQTYEADPFAAKQLRMVVEAMDSGERVGVIDLYDFSPVNGTAYVGVLVDSRFRGKGYAASALALLERFAATRLGMRTLCAAVAISNTDSIRLFGRAGYDVAGKLRQWMRRPFGSEDVVLLQKFL